MDPLQRYLSSMGYPYRHVTLPSSSSSSKGLAKSSSNNSLSASNQTHNLSNSTLTPAAERLPHQMEKSSSTIDVNGLNMSELDKLKNESGSFPRVYAKLFFDRMIPKQHKAYAVKTELGDFCFALRIADDKCLIVVFSEDETTSFELSYSSYSIPLFTTLDSLINSYFHIILHCYLKTLSQSSSAINKSPSFPTSLSACLSQSNLNLSDLLTSPDNCKGLIKGPVTELKQMNDYFGKFKYLEKPIETGMVKVDVAIEDGSDVPSISYKVFLSSLGTKIRGELLRKSGSAEEMSDAGIQSQLSLNCNKKAQQHVLKELLVTEKSYVVKLQCIKELYDYLQQHADPEKQKPQISITRQEFNEIFNTLNEIWGVNVAFLKDLETCVYQGRSTGVNEGQGEIDLGRLATVVRTHLPHMHIYGRFISTFEKRIELYKELYKTDEFVDLMGNFETSTQVFDDPGYIENLLIEPVQRIGRYCLLLKELMKVTTPADEGYEELRKAEKVAKETANKVNALPEVVEQSMFMHKIGWLITGFPDTYLSGTRRFISAHSVNETTHFPTFETCHKKTVLLLFNDILVIAKGVIPSELNGCNANDFISWCGRVKGGAFRFKEVVKLGKCKIGVVNNGSGCQIFYTNDDGQNTVASLTVPKSTLKDNFKRFMSKLYDAKVGLEYQNQPNCSIYRQTVDDVNVYFHVYRRNAYDMSSIKNKITLYYHSTSDIPTLSASASVEQSPYMVGFIQALPGAGGPPRFKYLVRSRIEFERENGTAQDENEGSIMEGDKVGPALGEHIKDINRDLHSRIVHPDDKLRLKVLLQLILQTSFPPPEIQRSRSYSNFKAEVKKLAMKDFKIPGLSNDKSTNVFAQPVPPNQQYQAQSPEKETLKERGKNWMATMTGAMSGAIPPLQITGRHKRQGSVSSIMSVRSMMGGRTKDRGVLPDFGAGSKAEEPTVEGAIRLLQYATNALRKKSLKSSEIFSRIQQAKESSDMAKAYNDILSHGQSLTEKHIRKLSPPTIIYVIKAYLTNIRPLISPECYKLMTETIETQGDDSAIGESCSSTFRELIEKYTPESKRRLLAKFIHFLTDLHTKIEGGSFNTGTFGIEFRDSIFEPIYPNQSSFDADQMQEATMSIHFDRTIFQVLMENYADIFIEGGNVDVDPSDGRSSVAGSSVNQSLRQQGSSTNLSIESEAPSTLLEMRKEEEKLLRRGSTIGKWKGKLTLNRSRGASQKLAQKIESVHSDAEEYLSKLDQYLDEMKLAVMNSLDSKSVNAQSDSAYASNDQIASDPSPEKLNTDIFCHSVGTHKQYLKDHLNNLRADFELLSEMVRNGAGSMSELAEEKFNLLEENKKLKLENANLKSDYDQVILERDDLDRKLQNLEQFIKSKSLAQDQIKQENDASAKTKSEIRRSQSDIPRFQNRGFKGIAFADKWRGLRESEVDLPGSSSTTLYTTDHGRVTLTEDHPLSS